MADESGPDDLHAPADAPAPAPTTVPPPAPPDAATRPALDPAPPVPAAPNPVMTAWTALDQTSQMIIGASIVVAATVLLGSLVSAWAGSGNFWLIMVVAAVAAGVTAWFTATTNAGPMPSKLPLSTIEFAAGAVATVLAALRTVELLFDFDDLGDYGGLIGTILTFVLLVAAAAMLAGAFRRDPTYRTPREYGDTGTRLAVSGLTLVILGWLMNLTIGFWTMGGAATAVGLLTFATVVIIVAPRWAPAIPEVPLSWVGAGLAAVSLLLAADQWGALLDLGATRIELGVLDFVGFLIYVIGIIVIVVGGLLGGRTWLASRPKRAPKPAPEAAAGDAAASTDAAPPADAPPSETASGSGDPTTGA